MSNDGIEGAPAASPLSRDELIALIARAHRGSSNEESTMAGRALAAKSQLPTLVAQNLGAGFGQWDFFPEADDIVDFALAYVRPLTPDDVWTIARAWASDDAAGRHTLMALAGRDILQHELRRIEVAPLRALIDEARPTRARELRVSLGLDVPASASTATNPSARRSKPTEPKPVIVATPATKAPDAPLATKMPKPAFKRPAPPAPPATARRFEHPKFGAGVLQSQDGVGPEAKMTIKFEAGAKTLLAKYVTELA